MVGQDGVLLNTRRQLLSADGYLTDAGSTLQQARIQLAAVKYDVLVICHSTDPVLAQQISDDAKGRPDPVPVYRMLRTVPPGEFLNAVAQLTGTTPVIGSN